jgi:hypothetical protein
MLQSSERTKEQRVTKSHGQISYNFHTNDIAKCYNEMSYI